mmetsp:Transcript_52366/g.126711  ORF Transcript_52366/g.126711 Transcript_52366/m.126711 type:complete len:331 (-) Transcript_52366:2383-3375(-)
MTMAMTSMMRIPALVATAVLVTVTSSCCSIVSLDAFVLPMLPGGHININSSSSNTSNNNKNAGLLGLSMIRRKSSSPSVTKSIFDIEDGSNQTDDDEEKEESASLLGKSSLFFESLFQSSSKKNDDDDDGIVVSATRPVPLGPTSTTSSDSSSRRSRRNMRRKNQLQEEETEQEEESAASAGKKFDMEQRVESLKSVVLGALAGGIAVSPIAFFHYVGNLPQWEFVTDMSSLQAGLFAIVYRYAARNGDDNPMLNQGVVGAFVLTRTLSNVQVSNTCQAIPLRCGEPLGYVDWNMLSQITWNGIESVAMFGVTALAMEYAYEKGWISKFE